MSDKLEPFPYAAATAQALELDALRAERDGWKAAAQEEIDRRHNVLEPEIQRLRAALEKLAANCNIRPLWLVRETLRTLGCKECGADDGATVGVLPIGHAPPHMAESGRTFLWQT